MVGKALVHQPDIPVEVVPDLDVEVNPVSQPRPGALRIVDLGGGVFLRYPSDFRAADVIRGIINLWDGIGNVTADGVRYGR